MYLFFGDAHFGNRYTNREDERIKLFVRFLKRKAIKAREIFIVGDLFEFWFEYRAVIPKRYYSILNGLCCLVESGVGVHYFMGNHEFGEGEFFKTLGFKVYKQERIFQLGKMRVLVGHGDDADDAWATRFMNFIFRSKVDQFLYRLIHPDIGIEIARSIARASREKSELHDSSRKLEQYALKKFQTEDIDAVVFGHSHLPVCKRVGKRFYLNVGDFLTHFTYGMLNREKLSLRQVR
ncbi:MAG: UDP-2,3-diacylglucosamine diphosphatase [candidate division WOR-3 bacterium]